ncbi:MAG: hypothetical protein GXX92_08295 [Clostridiales bacterium]|nr:hypothetical protein [Clostridiales bacterium]
MTTTEIASILSAVKRSMADGTTVTYNGTKYKPTACILRYVNVKWLYSVELRDLLANSVMIVEIDKISFERNG